jgi:hypothetical protein
MGLLGPSPSSAYSAFIRRPMKRSISQSSVMTHRSLAPSIPPLALGPVFITATPVTPTQPSPLKTHFFPQGVLQPPLSPIPSSPPLPPAAILATHRVSHVSEEVDAQSFVTARSIYGAERSTTTLQQSTHIGGRSTTTLQHSGRENPMRFSLASSISLDIEDLQATLPPMLSPIPASSSADNMSPKQLSPSDHNYSQEGETRTNTPVALSTTLGASSPLEPTLVHGSSPVATPSAMELYQQGEAAAEAEYIARQPHARTSQTSSFLDRRWHIGRWSIADGFRQSKASTTPSEMVFNCRPLSRIHDDMAAIYSWLSAADICELLFWIGFIAGPWCWVIGGWLVPLRQHVNKEDLQIMAARRLVLGTLPNGAREDLLRCSDVESGDMDCPTKHTFVGSYLWRRRCRLAAIIGLTAVLLALVVATIVMATMR